MDKQVDAKLSDKLESNLIRVHRDVFQKIEDLKSAIEAAKPNDRSENDRYYAIIMTDLQKIEAFFQYWIDFD